MEHPVIITDRNEICTDDSLIARYLRTTAGRQALAASMVQPLRRRLDYQGIARKAFLIEPMPEGALPYYYREDK